VRLTGAFAACLALTTFPGSTVAARFATHLVYTRDLGTKHDVWIANGDGRGARRLAAGLYGLVSPRGDVVAIYRGTNDLYLVKSDGSGARLLARGLKPFVWAPNGRTLLAYRGLSMFSLEVASGRRTLLFRGSAYGASVSPDSRALAYARALRRDRTGGCNENMDLHVVGLDGSGRRQVTRDGRSGFPLWGPRHITFARVMPNCVTPVIWRVRPDGSRLRPLLTRIPARFTSNGFYGFSPVGWVTGGKELVLGLRSEWGSEAVVLQVGSGRLRRLHEYVDDVSADGRYLVGTQGGAEGPYTITIVPTAGGHSRLVARGSVCCVDWNR
jgi:hypothetical protein